jgi:hypothetical protein
MENKEMEGVSPLVYPPSGPVSMSDIAKDINQPETGLNLNNQWVRLSCLMTVDESSISFGDVIGRASTYTFRIDVGESSGTVGMGTNYGQIISSKFYGTRLESLYCSGSGTRDHITFKVSQNLTGTVTFSIDGVGSTSLVLNNKRNGEFRNAPIVNYMRANLNKIINIRLTLT